MHRSPHSLTVVLAEDDDGHALLVSRHLKRGGHVGDIVRMRDGSEVMSYFQCPEDLERSATVHRVLLLDINLPKIDGVEVLARLRRASTTATLPIVMLTTTDDPRDVKRCYGLGCNLYLCKPVVHQRFADAIHRLGQLLGVIEVPVDVPDE